MLVFNLMLDSNVNSARDSLKFNLAFKKLLNNSLDHCWAA